MVLYFKVEMVVLLLLEAPGPRGRPPGRTGNPGLSLPLVYWVLQVGAMPHVIDRWEPLARKQEGHAPQIRVPPKSLESSFAFQ